MRTIDRRHASCRLRDQNRRKVWGRACPRLDAMELVLSAEDSSKRRVSASSRRVQSDFARCKGGRSEKEARAGDLRKSKQHSSVRASRSKAVSMPVDSVTSSRPRDREGCRCRHGGRRLGTGLFTDLSMTLSDMIGTRATEFEAKWREAKEDALYELKMNAHDMGCNAVVGVDVELATVQGIAIIIVVGTGVVLARTKNRIRKHPEADSAPRFG